MNDLLLEFLGNILDEAKKDERFRAVSVTAKGERITYFGSEGAKQDAIKAGTHRPYLPSMDKNLKDGGDSKKDKSKPKSKKSNKTTSKKRVLDPEAEIRALQLAGEMAEFRPNSIVDGIFSDASVISIAGTPTAVRQIIDEKGNVIDVSTHSGRTRAVKILNARINQFEGSGGQIERACELLGQKSLPEKISTPLRKWLGNLGELCGLRDMLAAGIESHLLSDSNPKNDIVSLIDCGGKGNRSDIKLVGISTKSHRGKKLGRPDASALSYIRDTVRGKPVTLRYGTGGKTGRVFQSEDIVTSLFTMQKVIHRALTKDTVIKRGEENTIVKPTDFDGNWDEDLFAQAVKAPPRGGGQRILMSARKITPDDVQNLFRNKDNPVYKQLLSDMTKFMGEESVAIALIDTLSYRLIETIEAHKGEHFSLADFNEWFTDEIVNIIDKYHPETNKPSSLVFQSDMMLATFDAKKGYLGMRLVAGEDMTTAVNRRYPDYSEMNTREKLKQVLGWVVNPRAIIPKAGGKKGSARGRGHVDPQQRAVAPLKLLDKSDFKSIEKFVEAKCKE
jgi:hypothetical protein